MWNLLLAKSGCSPRIVTSELECVAVKVPIQSKSSYCKYFSYNPFDGPNENPEAELPLTAGEYIYIYGDMDEDGFFEGVF